MCAEGHYYIPATPTRNPYDRSRHTLITELSENGTSREAIKSMVGHVSDAMVERYSHIRMEAKRAAVEKIAANQREATKKWRKKMKRQPQKPTATAGGVQ